STLKDSEKLKNPKKRPVKEAFIIITSFLNLHDHFSSPSYKSKDNSFDAKHCSSKPNSYDKLDLGIYEDVDENSFITKNRERLRNIKSNSHNEFEKDRNYSNLLQTDTEINAEGHNDDEQMSASDYEKFYQKYQYENFKKMAAEYWNCYPDNENYLNEGVFMEGELAEIQKFQVKPLLTLPKELLTYFNSFCL
ncbi:16398_t:CDS:2, partial [Cetraspora pellucida]